MTSSKLESASRLLDAVELDYVLECLAFDGYAVVPNVLPNEMVLQLSEALDRANDDQIAKWGRPRLEELKDFGVVRDSLVGANIFRELVVTPLVLQVVDRVVGPTAILHLQNGIVLEPRRKHFQAYFHRDFAKDFVADKVLALNAMFAIDEFSAASGGTWVVPGTHRSSRVPSARYLEAHGVQIEAPPGSLFFFDSLLFHKAGENRGSAPRRAINHMYTRPFIKQQLDYAGLFRGKVDSETRLAQLLGLWSMPPRDVDEYRVDPDKRTYRGGQG